MTKGDLGFIILAFFIWRGFLQLLAWNVDHFISYQPSFPFVETLEASGLPRSLYSWANFDGIHYQTIARQGYNDFGLIQAFFPAYPLLIRFLLPFGLSPLISSLLIAHLATLAFLLGLFSLAKSAWGSQRARWLLLGTLFFPTSFYLIAGYTEAVFLALLVWSYWLIKRRQFWLAALLGVVASATRVVGVLWSSVILLEYWRETRPFPILWPRRLKFVLTLAGLTLLTNAGFLLYSGYLQHYFHDFFYYLHLQEYFGASRSDSFVLLPQVFWRATKILLTARPFDLRYYTYLLEFASGLWGLLSLVLAWRLKLPRSLILFSALAYLVPTLTGTFSSLPRYLLTMPTAWLSLGLLLEHLHHRSSSLTWLTLACLATLLSLSTMLFLQGHWLS